MVSRTSVAVVLIAPVIIIAAHLWIAVSLFTMARLDPSSFVLVPVFHCTVRKMSAAYNIWGIAMDKYN
jgi:hypothetical protein